MKVVSVVGDRNSGKTTLVERLVPVLNDTGRVATVKSIHHDVEIDTPGKDTYRHRSAGAETVVGVTPSYSFTIAEGGREVPDVLDSVLDSLHRDGFDFVIVEGFKGFDLPYVALGDVAEEDLPGWCLLRVPDGADPDLETIVNLITDLDTWQAENHREE